MVGKFKKLTAIALSAAMLPTLPLTVAQAATNIYLNFDDSSITDDWLKQQVPLANSGKIDGHDVTVHWADGRTGKNILPSLSENSEIIIHDLIYTATAFDLPDINAASGTIGAEINFYSEYTFSNGVYWSNDTGTDTTKTLELSFKYDEYADSAFISSRYLRADSTSAGYIDWVKFEGSNVYVGGQQVSGIVAKPNEWYRIVIEQHRYMVNSKVFINGNQYSVPSTYAQTVSKNQWTQCQVSMNGNTGRDYDVDLSLSLDDIETYENGYTSTANDKITYSVNAASGTSYDESTRTLTVTDNTLTGEAVKNLVSISSPSNVNVEILESLPSNRRKSANTVCNNGNVIVLISPDKLTMEYIYIKKADPSEIMLDYNFSDSSQVLTISGDSIAGTTRDNVLSASGRAVDDRCFIASASVSDLSNQTVGLHPGFYQYSFFESDTIRTLEIALKYNADAGYTAISTATANRGDGDRVDVYDWVKFEGGKIYVTGVEVTDRIAKPNEWFRIVIEEHFGRNESKVYINGYQYPTTTRRPIHANLWTQIRTSAATAPSTPSVSVDDLKTYNYAHTVNENHKAIYMNVDPLSRIQTINRGMTAQQFTDSISVNDGSTVAEADKTKKMFIDDLNDNNHIGRNNGYLVSGAAIPALNRKANVLTIISPDGKTIEYIYPEVKSVATRPEYHSNHQENDGFYAHTYKFTVSSGDKAVTKLQLNYPGEEFNRPQDMNTPTITGDGILFGLILITKEKNKDLLDGQLETADGKQYNKNLSVTIE